MTKEKVAPSRRSGVLTTEFWISAASVIGCFAAIFLADSLPAVVGMTSTAIGYQFSRAWLKASRIKVDL